MKTRWMHCHSSYLFPSSPAMFPVPQAVSLPLCICPLRALERPFHITWLPRPSSHLFPLPTSALLPGLPTTSSPSSHFLVSPADTQPAHSHSYSARLCWYVFLFFCFFLFLLWSSCHTNLNPKGMLTHANLGLYHCLPRRKSQEGLAILNSTQICACDSL